MGCVITNNKLYVQEWINNGTAGAGACYLSTKEDITQEDRGLQTTITTKCGL